MRMHVCFIGMCRIPVSICLAIICFPAKIRERYFMQDLDSAE